MYAIRDLDRKLWPERLREIPQPPERLRIAGTMPPDKDLFYLAVVGARKFTPYGERAVNEIVRGLAGYPIVIVSGLAYGIDSLAHLAALDAGLTTLAFPGSGLSSGVLYPRTNRLLAAEIVAKGGALIAEYDDNFISTPYAFPQRNRLMAGISHATLVIEAEIKSGSLITARLATEYDRDVLAVPGSIFSALSRGTNKLIERGATPVTCSRDILEHWGIATEETGYDGTFRIPPDCTPIEHAILQQLAEPQERDALLRSAKLTADEANIALATLELKGLIAESMGKIHLRGF